MNGPASGVFFSAIFIADSIARLPWRQNETRFMPSGASSVSRLARRSSGTES